MIPGTNISFRRKCIKVLSEVISALAIIFSIGDNNLFLRMFDCFLETVVEGDCKRSLKWFLIYAEITKCTNKYLEIEKFVICVES